METRTPIAALREVPDGVVYALAVSLGLRRGEVIGLSWDAIDLDALRHHRQAQRKARIHAGAEWRESGLVFTTITGRPVSPRDHSVHWTAFLEGLGIRPARLHDARHTAATLLLVQGVDQRVVMSMFGGTSPARTTRYQHVVPELAEEANRRMGELLWARPNTRT